LVRFVLSFFEKAEPKLTVRPNPVSTMITLAARIAEEHPRAAPLAYRIRTEAEELRAEPTPRPISAARTDDPERTLLLFCPEQGGWQTGVFFESRWLDYATLSVDLHPTHFADVLPDPVDI